MQIHLIEKNRGFTREDKFSQIWQSGYWKVNEDVAKSLVGGDIYFHPAKIKPSYFGGKILGYSVVEEGEWQGRIVFEFEFTREYKGVSAGKDGWGMDKKIVTD
jgi:hypothetical protein